MRASVHPSQSEEPRVDSENAHRSFYISRLLTPWYIFTFVLYLGFISISISIFYVVAASIKSLPESRPPYQRPAYERCVNFEVEAPETGIIIDITISTLLSLYVAYSQLRGSSSHVAILERPISDLYNHIGWVTIPTAWIYCFLGATTSSGLLAALRSIRSGNFIIFFLCTFSERRTINRLVFGLIHNILTNCLLSHLEKERNTFIITNMCLLISFFVHEVLVTYQKSDALNSHLVDMSIYQETVWKRMEFILQVIFLMTFTLLSIIYLCNLWKPYHSLCLPRITFAQAIPALALIKPLSSFYYYKSLSTYILKGRHNFIVSTSYSTAPEVPHVRDLILTVRP
ncbi:hypothetical protein F5B19DRAFT_129548 [Rostrohypoxylon terebratum]|nr:hypothetical protein F5B19DRAFT_129548 [Rostrohypoxylon terebratum]